MTHAHNDYLQLLAEGGLIVEVPVVIAVVLLAFSIRRRLKEPSADSYDYWVRTGAAVGLVAIAVQETAEFSLHMPANALLFATLAAVAISSPYRLRADAQRLPAAPGRRRAAADDPRSLVRDRRPQNT